MTTTTSGLEPFFSDEQRELADSLTSIDIAEHEPAAVARSLGRQFDLYRHLVPQDGRDVAVRALVLIREALGRVSPLADALFAVQGLGSYPIALFGDATQRSRFLAEAIAGDRIAAFALTEPNAGSDVASLQTLASADGNGWRLDGDKTLISNVPIADHYVVFANADPQRGRKGISAFIVDKDNDGVEVERQPMSIDHPIGAIRFRHATAELLGEVGAGFRIALQTLETFRISVGAAANGMASAALDDALAHCQQRQQFGKPLAEQQMVQAYLADMATELDAARLLVARAAWLKDTTGGRPAREVAMAKMYATEAAQRIIDRALQLHGGRGVLSGTRVEALYRDIRPLRIYEGTTEIQKLIIARSLLA